MRDDIKNKEKNARDFNYRLLIAVFLGLALILCLSVVIILKSVNYDLPSAGQVGDMFGAANAIFSSLALIGVIVAIYLQKNELSLQRQELEETRNELARTAQAQENAGIAFIRQAESLAETARLTALSYRPVLEPFIGSDMNGNLIFYLNNVGKTSAYDLEFFMLSSYDNSTVSLENLIAENNNQLRSKGLLENQLIPLELAIVGTVGEYSLVKIYESFFLGEGEKLFVKLPIPRNPFGIETGLQFRDSVGTNYFQTYHFQESYKDDSKQLLLTSLTPVIPAVSPRIRRNMAREAFHPLGHVVIEAESEAVSVSHDLKEFFQRWNNGISLNRINDDAWKSEMKIYTQFSEFTM